MPRDEREAWCSLSYKNEFYLHGNINSFSYERLCTKPRFHHRAKSNLEMAYCFVWHPASLTCKVLTWQSVYFSVQHATVINNFC